MNETTLDKHSDKKRKGVIQNADISTKILKWSEMVEAIGNNNSEVISALNKIEIYL
jgi:hypothetical protein